MGQTALYWGPKLLGTEQSRDKGEDFVEGLRLEVKPCILFLTLSDLPGGLPQESALLLPICCGLVHPWVLPPGRLLCGFQSILSGTPGVCVGDSPSQLEHCHLCFCRGEPGSPADLGFHKHAGNMQGPQLGSACLTVQWLGALL